MKGAAANLRSMRRLNVPGVTLVAALSGAAALFAAAPASAATTYHVSPSGSGSACTQASPCSLSQALGSAGGGDTIVLAGDDGTYGTSGSPISTEIDIPDGVTLTGDTTQAMPVIYSNNTSGLAEGAVYVEGASSVLQYVDVEWSGSFSAVSGLGTWNRVIAHATSGSACTFYDGATTTVTDSVCNGNGAGVYENFNTSSGTIDYFANLDNDTIVSPSYGMFLDAESVHIDMAMTLENTIVRSTASVSPTDIFLTENGDCGIAQVTASYSNYANVVIGDNSCGNVVYTLPTTDNNQTAAPLFVDAASNDFAQASGSPTIGAGTNDTANDGSFDLTGALRDINGRTDIGAYEYVYAPIVATGAPSGLATSAGTVNATVNPNGASTSYGIDYGTSATYGSASSTLSLAPAASAQSIAVALSGLAASTTYHFRVVATNSAGTTDGPDETFTTASPPAAGRAPSPPPLAPAISLFTQSRTRWARGSTTATFARAHRRHAKPPVGTKFSLTLNETAAVELTFTRNLQGRRGRNGACVAATKHNRHRAKCSYTRAAGTVTDAGAHSGLNTIGFAGLTSSGQTLVPGSYTVSASASASGLSASPMKLSFTVIKR